MTQDVNSNNTDIEYVYVEMVLNQERNYEVVSGLLQGVIVKEGSTFILLHGEKDVTNILSLRFYNIMTIEVLYKTYKDLTYPTIERADQDSALNILGNVYKDLLKDDFYKDKEDGLIRVSKYTNIPDTCRGNVITGKRDSAHDKQTGTSHTEVGSFVNRASSMYVEQKKKELVPSIFNRATSKKPSKSFLDLMQRKIDQINSGDFKYDPPKMLNSIEDQDNKDFNTEDQDDLCDCAGLHWA